jgi:hypothetical protein
VKRWVAAFCEQFGQNFPSKAVPQFLQSVIGVSGIKSINS